MGWFREVIVCQPIELCPYRYLLQVRIGSGARLAVILKNPSMADAAHSDPTVGKVEAWARRQGFGVVTYANLFAFRSPYPGRLNGVSYVAAVGPENDAAILQSVMAADVVVLAWGNPNGINGERYQQRINEVLSLLSGRRIPPLCRVGALTHAGYPRHGLHWNGGAELVAF
jgi:hypothetical protein